MKRVQVAGFSELEDRQPVHARIGDVNLVIVRYDDDRFRYCTVDAFIGVRCLRTDTLMGRI